MIMFVYRPVVDLRVAPKDEGMSLGGWSFRWVLEGFIWERLLIFLYTYIKHIIYILYKCIYIYHIYIYIFNYLHIHYTPLN